MGGALFRGDGVAVVGFLGPGAVEARPQILGAVDLGLVLALEVAVGGGGEVVRARHLAADLPVISPAPTPIFL